MVDKDYNEQVQSFLTDNKVNYTEIVKLTGDASTREYSRVHTIDNSFVLCFDSRFKEIDIKNYPFYIVHQIFNDTGICVPSIKAADSKTGLLLLLDLGNIHLENLYDELSEKEILDSYIKVIESLIKIQSIKPEDFIPFNLSFDTDKLMYEFDYFIENALKKYFKSEINQSGIDELRTEFLKISEILNRPDFFVLNHRDFHSRNIIFYENTPYLIDFQDARMGLPQYDLVSLLRDSYVNLETDSFNYLKDYYFERSTEEGINSMDRGLFDYYFDIMAFQRNVKAVGTFGYMVSVMENRRYEKYIEPTLRYLNEYAAKQDELKKAYSIIKKHTGL